MRRVGVLHVARDWVRPSERFVTDAVRFATATRSTVACGQVHSQSPADDVRVPVVDVARRAARIGRFAPVDDVRRLRAALLSVAVSSRADVLHAHFGYWAAHTEVVARRLGRPWAVSLHGHDLLVEAAADPEHLDRISRADLIVVPSAFLRDRAVDLGLPSERLRIAPSGIDLALHAFRQRTATAEPMIAFAGRFVAKKGVLDAVTAMAEVHTTHPSVRPVLVGTGPLHDEIVELLGRLGLRAEIRDGARPGELARTLQEADVLLTPSRTAADGDAETLGLVNIEAQAAGLPVVTTRHGGIPEAVSPDAGVLVDEGDIGGLVAALRDLLDVPERWADMGRAGRAHVIRNFEVGRRVTDLEALWRELADGRSTIDEVDGFQPSDESPGSLPTISVITVTHQRRDLLVQTLQALDAQTYPRDLVEVVVVDNGTTDGTSQVLDEWSSRLPLRVLTNDHNEAVARARNRAVGVSAGDLLAFTDDDCRPQPTWLEALLAGRHAGADIVQGRTTADPTQHYGPLSRSQFVPAEYGLYETCNILYDRRAFEAVGGFDEELAQRIAEVLGKLEQFPFGEDTDLAWRAKRAGARSTFAPTAVVHHHVFQRDVRLLARRAAVAAAFPALVRRVPELRDRFLVGRYWLGRRRIWFHVAVAGLAVAVLATPAGALGVIPYGWSLLRPRHPGRRARLRAAPALVAVEFVEVASLAYGSARARTLVL